MYMYVCACSSRERELYDANIQQSGITAKRFVAYLRDCAKSWVVSDGEVQGHDKGKCAKKGRFVW